MRMVALNGIIERVVYKEMSSVRGVELKVTARRALVRRRVGVLRVARA